MRLLSLVCGLMVLPTLIFGHSISHRHDTKHSLEKRALLPVTGPGGKTQPRLEVRQMKTQKPDQWTLFLLALKKFQGMPQSAKASYYQIAGIHGDPAVPWDGVGRCSACSKAQGYCTHDSILFLGWHRAYLALFEQELIKIAKDIAGQYTGTKKAAMQNAASLLRLPYWDWAAHPGSGANVLPSSITSPTVTVLGPGGNQNIANPLFKHTFADPSQLHYSPYVNWKSTLRWPTSTAANAVSDNSKAVTAFNNIRPSLQDQVYNLFSNCDEFAEIGADAKSTSSVKCRINLETIHNTIHSTAGGKIPGTRLGGHMTVLPEAAFDPVFWLHHCNVDRLFALWQVMYPNSYSGSQVAPNATWTIAKGTVQDVNSPLTPFHRDASGNFWTTTLVRNTKTFAYTYPEIADSDGSKGAIASYINKLYGPKATATAGSSKRNIAPRSESANGANTATSLNAPTDGAEITPLKADNGSLFQYIVNIEASRYALGGAYNIFLFNNAPEDENPESWLFDANLIGPMSVLGQPGMTESDVIATGSIPLTRTLTAAVDAGALSALTEPLVVPYLKTHLQWRVTGPTGVSVDPDSIPAFEISVYASTAKPASEYTLPVWSKFIPLAEVTKHKKGGATPQSINGIEA